MPLPGDQGEPPPTIRTGNLEPGVESAAEASIPVPVPRKRSRLAVSTAIFSAGTALSRVAGLGREIIASSYFGTGGPFSAFTIAFQVPNILRGLVADAALQAAFVPVFTELLEKGRKREAVRLASTLFGLIFMVLGAISLVFVLAAPAIMPLFTGAKFAPGLDDLTVGLSQVLFGIVVLLGLTGLVVGVLFAYEHFTVPALAPVAWNVVIIACLFGLVPLFDGPDRIYAYAIGILAGTIVQLVMVLPVLGRVGFRLRLEFDLRDPRIWQVLKLMLPVTIGLGVINLDLLINSSLGTLVSDQAPRAIDAAFRIFMLPQGIFSVALATVLFPALSRFAVRRDYDGLRATMANGMRQMLLLLIPAAAFTIAIPEPIVRLVYQRGDFGAQSTDLVALALFWFSFNLPFTGLNLLMTRTFFSIQRPWVSTSLALGNLVVNFGLSIALYKPFGIAGLVIASGAAGVAMAFGQAWYLRRELNGIEGGRTLKAAMEICLSAALLGVVAFAAWHGLDATFGRTLPAQLASVGGAIAAGIAVYALAVTAFRIPEAAQIRALVGGRLRRGRPA